MPSRTTRVVAAVAAQALLVGVAVWAPLSARLTGQEVRLRVAPFDPVDPFRGAYVDLDYPDLPDGATTDPASGDRGTVYVPLTRQGEVWVGGPPVRERPAGGLHLRCDDSSWRLRCGIESLFLPQGDAVRMQSELGGGGAVARVKVGGRGHAALLGVESPGS